MSTPVAAGSATGRWVLTATVLGSGMALLDGTVVNLALPFIGRDLGASLGALQWVVNGYLLTLASLILVGGSLGDRFGRTRVFVIGVVWFALASVACALAPSTVVLIVARLLQGVGGALLTPGSLAMIQGVIAPADRASMIGRWAGLGGIAAAVGPLLGGWLLQVADWHWIFWINVPVAVVVVAICLRFVPESRDPGASARFDAPGAVLAVLSLGGLTYALIGTGSAASAWVAGAIGVLAGAVFLRAERRPRRTTRPAPLVPLPLFNSKVFSAANAMTLLVYAALGTMTFFVVLELEIVLGWTPLAAGLSLLPLTVVMLLFSSRAAVLGQRIGPRPMMSVGPLLCAVGVLLLSRVGPGSSYLLTVFPGVLVFAVGLTTLVAPLTATVLAAAPDRHAGTASGINNAIARTGSLLAVAALPALVGLSGDDYRRRAVFDAGYTHAMWVCAGLLAGGGLVSWVGLRPTRG